MNKPTRTTKTVKPTKKVIPFQPLRFTDEAFRITAFIYGSSGSGKTYMLRTLQENKDLFPVLILVCDQGHLSLKGTDPDKIQMTAVSTYDEIEGIYEYLQTDSTYKTVVLDNISELHRRFLIDRSKKRGKENSEPDSIVLRQDDYGNARSKIMDILAGYALNLSQNVIVNALAHVKADPDTEREYIIPNLFGKVAEEAPGLFDLVGYLTMHNPSAKEKRLAQKEGNILKPQRKLYTEETSKIKEARIRGGVLPPVMLSPTWSQIYETWKTNYLKL